MIFLLKNSSDQSILLKSALWVFCAAALILLLVRHTVPVLSEDRSYGGSVFLMLPGKEGDIKNFIRWQMLNQPGSIFGYNSSGIFASLLPEKIKNTIPGIPHFADIREQVPKLVMPEYAVIPLRTEKSMTARSVLPVIMVEKIKKAEYAGIPVFDSEGNVYTMLQKLPEVAAGGALLLRAEKSWTGTAFRIIESSGSREFDNQVVSALENKSRQGEKFSGILAVWPELRSEK